MPSQEEYLDNLLKGIETENTETEVTKEPKMTGTEEETAKAPETPEPVEESGIQVDMSDMDDLLQSALDAQKADSSEQETEASQPVAENTAILPEETASMSEDEINRLLQQSQEQSGDAPAQESNDANDDLIKMLENADDEGLSNILDQVTPETAQPEETAEREEDNGKRGKKKKEKKKKEKKLGFFERFKKKSKEEPEAAPDETESAQPAGEEVTSDIPETVPDDLADLSSLKDGMDDTDKTPMEASDNTESVESTENAAENGDAGGLDDDLDALLAGAFPEQSENSTDNASGEPESADVMDILKAAGADIMDEPEQKKEKKGFFAKLLDLFTEEDEEEEHEHHHHHYDENGVCSCGHHHDHDDECCHHDHDHEHHHHEGHHHADDVFTSWGEETPNKYDKEALDAILKKLANTNEYGSILRAKGMLPANDGTWMYFDLVPEEYEIREGNPDYTGRICVIGAELKEDALKELFNL